MRVRDHIVRRPIDEEVLEAPHKSLSQRTGPQCGWETEVGVHVVDGADVQIAGEVQLVGVAYRERRNYDFSLIFL